LNALRAANYIASIRARPKMKSRIGLLLLPFDLIIDKVTGFYVKYRVRSIKRVVFKLGIRGVSLALIMFIMRTR